jgi:hypothetical protein
MPATGGTSDQPVARHQPEDREGASQPPSNGLQADTRQAPTRPKPGVYALPKIICFWSEIAYQPSTRKGMGSSQR